MDYILFDDFKNMDIYEDFKKKNPLLGMIKVQVTTASGSLPLEDVSIEIYKDIGEYDVLFFQGKTNSSGIIDSILLPAPGKVPIGSLEIPEYAVYTMNVFKEGFDSLKKYSFAVYGGVEVLQNIVMNADVNIEKN